MSPADFLAVVIVVWFWTLVALLAWKLLTGKVNAQGMLANSVGDAISPERTQMLLTTIASVYAYAQMCVVAHDLVEPPALMVAGTAGSQALYLIGKYVRHTVSPSRT